MIELAREHGPTIVEFLVDVMNDKYVKLGYDKQFNIFQRLSAAELLRKFASLPQQVALDLGVQQKIIYMPEPLETTTALPEPKGKTTCR